MYCQQCQEAKSPACTSGGVCRKNAVISAYQDAVLFTLSGLAYRLESADKSLEPCVLEALFSTQTNTGFDKNRFLSYLACITSHKDALPTVPGEPAACAWTPKSEEEIVTSGLTGLDTIEDVNTRSLYSLLLFGIKGLATYYSHAVVLGKTDETILPFITKALASRFKDMDIQERIGLVLECGEIGVKTLALLDSANHAYGIPEITSVPSKVGTNPGILVTGNDLKDLELLLKATENTGIDIYTHGEMLPAHAYPGLKKYPHLKGNYGSSWANQRTELPKFNGPILFTTNCLVPPATSYEKHVFTTGAVGFPGCPHIGENPDATKDFSALISLAKTCQAPEDLHTPALLTGCAHDAVVSLAPKVLELVNTGKIKRFVVMAGCDGRDKKREYYTEFAKALPKDTVILTAGCAKYRYNFVDLGDIEGIPRILDAGQCNDSYSLVVIALTLAEACTCGVNDLPISYNIAWYEQKAVLVLPALLHLGIKDIMLGPSLPNFISPDVLDVLVKTFGLQPSSSVEEDLVKLKCV